MKTILYLLQKEFLQIVRDKMMLPIIFAIPVMQLLILSYTATFEIKHIALGIADLDRSTTSIDLCSRFLASPFYEVKEISTSFQELEQHMQKGELEQIIYIPAHFEKDLLIDKQAPIQIITDAINGSAANIMNTYSTKIIADYNRDFLIEELMIPKDSKNIQTEVSFWFNPQLNYQTFMVPGILVLLITIIGLFLTALNVVKEKEIGTIEQLNVTPIKKYQFIIGKLLPFWLIAMFDLILGLFIARFVFSVPMLGSIPMVLSVASVYLVLVLAMGLFISGISNTQKQSMFISWFFAMAFILLSGLFTPVENMPIWATWLNVINPIAYFIEFIRLVMLKGAAFTHVWHLITAIATYALIMVALATWSYRKVN
ncbi:MAG: ABC transporter permease [Bacteroidetes bacterium 4572_77]|nr:MAG: ABC transporter permease [Bacteroidetes bacterium 4572_77]